MNEKNSQPDEEQEVCFDQGGVWRPLYAPSSNPPLFATHLISMPLKVSVFCNLQTCSAYMLLQEPDYAQD
jgi:hypothetical protein